MLLLNMYASAKIKVSKKNKEKARGSSIEDGIPEIPRINDFQVTDCSEFSRPSGEPVAIATHNSLDTKLDLIEKKNEEKKITLETNSNPEDSKLESKIEEEFTSCVYIEKENKENSRERVENPEDPDNKVSVDEISHFYCSDNEYKLSDSSLIKNSSSDSLKISDYCHLQTQLETLIQETNEPSAPTAEENITAQNVFPIHILEKGLSDTEKPVDISKLNFSINLEDALAPFSDDKLSEYYYNSELHESKTYAYEFINQEINNETKKSNRLYKLLIEYMQTKNRVKATEIKINDLKEKLNTCISALWTVWNDVNVTEKEKCSDGNVVSFTEKYTQAQFNADIFKEFFSVFAQIKHEIYEVYTTNSFACSMLRLKIEYFLESLLTSCPEFTNLEEESPVQLLQSSLNSHFQQCLLDLKTAISVLFMFQRKQSLEIDSNFLAETRGWLSDLVAVLLRKGNWKDQIFLLHHIMRCPGGVCEWAAQFVQLPLSKKCIDPFKNAELNHMMTVMSVLLSPIEERENFIKKWESELTSDSNPWTVIDSDGEVEDEDQHSCPLKENDLVSLLNQIPFSHLFKVLLNCDGMEITSNYVTFDYVLKLFSFLTDLIKILLSGLKLYSTQRYRQFTKRLGRLICHIVQYATDVLVIVKSQKLSESEMKRIQVEYDNFFLRSTKFIYSAKKHGTWQFLATIPYHMPSSNAILKLYGILQLNNNEDDCIVKVDFSKFAENFLLLPEEEQFYLLTTFANMGLARGVDEIQFIKNILFQLLFIGFLNLSTVDHCYKNVRLLVCNMCSSYPFLMSEILGIQKNAFLTDSNNDQKLTLDLWAKLPVEIWQPNPKDLETLSSWLLEPVDSVRSELARLILQSLDYGVNLGELFIPLKDQRIIALMILQANAKLFLGNEAGVIKNVSNLVLYQSPDQSINDWTWYVLPKLRLHLLDKSDAEMFRCFYNLPDYLQNIPDVRANPELHHLVLKRHPVACYIALMTTTLGHSVPVICEEGFELVEVLFNLGKYEPGLACLEHMTLLFLDCSDSLVKSEKFISLLSRLIAADNSYIQFAKNLVSCNFPGPVLKSLESMMQHQLNRWRGVNFSSFSNVIQLWLLSLTRIPLWTQEPGILYLIDKLLVNSFFDGVSAKKASAILRDLLEAQLPPSETKSFSSLVSWMNSKYTPPSLLSKGFNGEVPWFSYHIIQMEFETFEKKSSVWIELLKELYSCGDKKISVDNSLKKVCNLLRIPVRSSNVLAIYKWSYQILETDFLHPLIPLIWQRFFSLYFYRVSGLTDRGSIGDKFFDGVINQGLFKRLKVRLQETCDYFKTLSENTEENEREHYLKCFYLFQTFSVWLYDPNLHKPCLSLHMLPIQYKPELLGLLIHGSETPWIEYLEYHNIEQNFKNTGLTWSKLKNRVSGRNRKKIISYKKEKSQKEKIIERLNSYENPLPPPCVDLKKYSFPLVNIDIMMNADKMILFVKPLLQVLMDYMKHYTNGVNEHLSLGCDMQELLPRLYITIESQKVLKGHCNGVQKVVNGKNVLYSCSGPAIVKLTYQESKLNEQVKQHFGHCEKAFEQNLEKAMSHLPPNLISAAVLIDIVIENLNREYHLSSNRADVPKTVLDLKRTGVHLFYELIRHWCELTTPMPPLEQAFENYVEALGKGFIEGNAEEIDRIFHLMLNDEFFGKKVCKYFTPNASPTYDFIANYSKALDFLSEERFTILSKFDLNVWLSEKKPKYSERSRMIAAVGRGLKSVKKFTEDRNMLKLLNKHLEILLMHDFPEHYGEVLRFLLEASASQSILASTWFTFLNALTSGQFAFLQGRTDKNILEPGQSVKKLKYYFSKFSTDQNLVSFEVIKDSIILLASTFKAERLKVGSSGLYRKYRLYVEPIFIFFGMLSYSFVAKAVEIDTGSLSDKLAQHLWPLISDLYSPWLVPFWMENHKEQMTQTQEQSTDHRVLLPWSLYDSCYASFGASVFVESVRFLFDALPGLNHVLSFAWFFYATNFAHICVKDYILNVIHESLLTIPWEAFFPSLQDVELMLKVVDQFLPLSHSFLGNIFINVKWTELVHYFLSVCDLETTTKLHICLLHLLVKLPLEPSLKQNDKVLALLTEANGYAWHLVDSVSYETVLNWYIMSCDSRIILMDERLEHYKLDSTILRLLQVCAGYVPFVRFFHPTTLTKRLMFVRTCVKWLITSNRRYKSKDSPFFKTALTNLWNDMDAVISETVPINQRVEEAGILLSEFLMIFSESDLCPIVEATLSNWLFIRKSKVIISGLFRAAGNSIENPSIFGSITESALESYFNNTENCDWNEVTNALVLCSKSKLEGRLEKVLIENNHFLALYAVLLKTHSKPEADFSSKVVLIDLLQLLTEVKISANLEPKLVLLIIFGLELAETEIKIDLNEGISYLLKFSESLNNFTNDKGNGFLSAIGLKKSGSSNRFKLVCLVACSAIAIFLKNSHPEYFELADDKVLQALESVENNKIYQNINQYATYAKNAVKEISTLEQTVSFLKHIGFKLFNKLYLK